MGQEENWRVGAWALRIILKFSRFQELFIKSENVGKTNIKKSGYGKSMPKFDRFKSYSLIYPKQFLERDSMQPVYTSMHKKAMKSGSSKFITKIWMIVI